MTILYLLYLNQSILNVAYFNIQKGSFWPKRYIPVVTALSADLIKSWGKRILQLAIKSTLLLPNFAFCSVNFFFISIVQVHNELLFFLEKKQDSSHTDVYKSHFYLVSYIMLRVLICKLESLIWSKNLLPPSHVGQRLSAEEKYFKEIMISYLRKYKIQ